MIPWTRFIKLYTTSILSYFSLRFVHIIFSLNFFVSFFYFVGHNIIIVFSIHHHRRFVEIMKSERLSDAKFANKIKSNSYYQKVCNILFFRIKYRCFEALLTNFNLNGSSMESKSKADSKFVLFAFLFFFFIAFSVYY